MPELTLDGKFYHAGIAGDPVVMVSALDQGLLSSWMKSNDVFTQLVQHKDPDSGIDRPAIYVVESAVSSIAEGTSVRVTIDVRPEKRGNGVRIVSVIPST